METIKTSGKMKEIKIVEKPKTLKEEMIESIENDTFYGFIYDNQHRFSHSELITIIQEYEYTRQESEKYDYDFTQRLIENLEERFDDEV